MKRECHLCRKDRHGCVRTYAVWDDGVPGPPLLYPLELVMCPRCRSQWREQIRTDRHWTQDELAWWQERADREYADWRKDLGE